MPTELQPPGELIDVNGSKVHVQRMGTGSPIVLFESGILGDSLVFYEVHLEVSKFTHTISYDRAGMGYSEHSSNPERTSKVIATELAELVETLNLEEPLILTGWSAGGLYVREFAAQHPEMVAGMILIDSSHENQNNGLPEDIEEFFQKIRDNDLSFFTKLSQLTHLEILEKFGDSPYWKNRHEKSHKYYADLARPERFEFLVRILSFSKDDFAQGEDMLRSLGDIPLVVLSRENISVPDLNEDQNAWIANDYEKNTAELAALSTASKHIKVDCGHDIANEKPEVVIEAIREVVEKVRAQNK